MIIIKCTSLRDSDSATGCHWYWGEDYMIRISKAEAKKLCDLPKMGYETVLQHKRCSRGFRLTLVVQNISGGFWLACSSTPTTMWLEVFGVQLERIK